MERASRDEWEPVTRADLADLHDSIVEVTDLKLGIVAERISGLRTWTIIVFGLNCLSALGATVAQIRWGVSPRDVGRSAVHLLHLT